jgi:hypothetical protein
MLTAEQRAEQNRQNAQHSTGPKTAAGKERSSRNAIKHGRRAEYLKEFVPPHAAVLCSQDRHEYFRIEAQLIGKYQPRDAVEGRVVRKIAEAEWRVQLIDELATAVWNRQILERYQDGAHPFREMAELYTLVSVVEHLADQPAIERLVRNFRKEQDRVILSNEKRLLRLVKHFACPGAGVYRKDFDRSRRAYAKEHPETIEAQVEVDDGDPVAVFTNEADFSADQNAEIPPQLVEK